MVQGITQDRAGHDKHRPDTQAHQGIDRGAKFPGHPAVQRFIEQAHADTAGQLDGKAEHHAPPARTQSHTQQCQQRQCGDQAQQPAGAQTLFQRAAYLAETLTVRAKAAQM